MRQVGTAVLCALLLAVSLPATAANPVYGKDYIIVTPGMTLTRLVREFYPAQRGQWAAIMDEIIRLNPHAFVNGAPASLKRGMRITLPGSQLAATQTPAAPAPSSSNTQRLTVTGAATGASASASGNVTRRSNTTAQVATGRAKGAQPSATTSGNVSRSVTTQPQVATGTSTRYVTNPDPTRRSSSSTSVAVAAASTTAAAGASTASRSGTSARVGSFSVTTETTEADDRELPLEANTAPVEETTTTAALPAPISDDVSDSGLDASTAPASKNPEEEKERPPWWWITSALLVVLMIL